MSSEARRQAIRFALGRGLFDAVVLGQSFWSIDPSDAINVHVSARRNFDTLLSSAKSGWPKTLLLVGETGAGKTHLLRAMRATASRHGSICAYAQFNAESGDYLRHFLKRLVDSLGSRFNGLDAPTTGLAQFFERCRACMPESIGELEACWSDDEQSDEVRRRAVGRTADKLLPALGLGPEDLS